VEVRKDILVEEDGPMLLHGLQECHGQSLLVVPKAAHLRPNQTFLEERYQQFREAG
jgi:putative restriction endonuclease